MEYQYQCPICKTEYAKQPQHCENCRYPFSASDKEKSVFVGQHILKKEKISGTKTSIKRARIILFLIAGFNIIIPLLNISIGRHGHEVIYFDIIIGMMFLFFGFMAKRRPFISILIPLIILISFYTINFIIEPISLLHGILWKIVFIGGLLYCLSDIRKSDRIRKESMHLSIESYM